MTIITDLNHLILHHADALEEWFTKACQSREIPIYSSVDIRHAGFKIAPVDTNLFPAGFNNLTPDGKAHAANALRDYLAQLPFTAGRALLMVESHTRNKAYLENVYTLLHICQQAGLETAVGRFDIENDTVIELETDHEHNIIASGVKLDGTTLMTQQGFIPDIILVNNDLSSGCPEILCDARQPTFPSPGMGWFRRRKSVHFTAYNQVASEFSRHFEIDPWLISTTIHHCGKINFKERTGLECVALGVEKALHVIRQKYEQYGIDREAYVFIKADNGTYGMGIMTVKSGEEVYDINKKTRNKMNIIKEGVQTTEVIIQEGVPTIDKVEGHVAEPMVYLMAGKPVGHIWRVNEERDNEQNLNAAGMRFIPCEKAQFRQQQPFSLIARLATLAAAYEHYDHEHENNNIMQVV